MHRRFVGIAIELRIIRLIFLEHVEDGGQQHSGNGDHGLFVATPLLEIEIAAADFRILFGTDSAKSTLYQQWLDIGSGTTNSGGFLLASALVVLRRKTGPRV